MALAGAPPRAGPHPPPAPAEAAGATDAVRAPPAAEPKREGARRAGRGGSLRSAWAHPPARLPEPRPTRLGRQAVHTSPAGTQGLVPLERDATACLSTRGQEQVLEELKINPLESCTHAATASPHQSASWAQTLYFWLFHEATGTCSLGRPGGPGGSRGSAHRRRLMTFSFLCFWICKWPGGHLAPCPGTHPATRA